MLTMNRIVNCARTRPLTVVAVALVQFAIFAYGPALNAPFVGDDYVFLDEVRDASFSQLWSRENTAFGWYRPWSRELHFWTLYRVAGLSPAAFRVASLILWISSLVLFGVYLSSISTRRVGALSTIGLAVASFWGAPLLWISGSQDLWMLVFAMAALLLYSRGHRVAALGAYLGALLSKETAAVLPLILCGYDWFVRKQSLRQVALRALPSLCLTIGWVLLHPTLLTRLFDPAPLVAGIAPRPQLVAVMGRTLLTVINVDRDMRALDSTAFDMGRTIASTFVLAIAAWLVYPDQVKTTSPTRKRVDMSHVWFAGFWAAVGWIPLFMPSIGWQAYYGCLGTCGAWFAIGALLPQVSHLAPAVVCALGLLRGISAGTRAWDWGSEWYQRRAGNMLSLIQRQMHDHAPTLNPHTRVFFGSIPNNVGLIAGQSPAIRVWYKDKTLEAGFYSYYHRRRPSDPKGVDRFFHFDSTRGLVEVKLGHEDISRAIALDPQWERNHEALAVTLLQGDDPEQAAVEFEKIARLPWRPDAQMFAAMAWERLGRLGRRDSLFASVSQRTGGTAAEIDAWAVRLRETMPRVAGHN